MADPIQVACYYFPNYHVDPRNERVHGPEWTEWELVRRAESRFSDHRQPRVPLWGYTDEADPGVMEQKIAVAADHGIHAFIFDWYWYDDGPFLARCLDEGFLRARNNEQLRFALMWANHDWIDIHPAKLGGGGIGDAARVLYPGEVTRHTWHQIASLLTDRYFSHPSYWRIAGRPYFSIYDLGKFCAGAGGLSGARRALDHLRDQTARAGLPGVHLNGVAWNVAILPGETAAGDPAHRFRALGLDSLTSYVWVHHGVLEEFPFTSYDVACDRYLHFWETETPTYGLPYLPNVTMGWDPSPRTVQSDRYLNIGYPFTPMLAGNTPDRFAAALAGVRRRLESQPAVPQVVTLNSWNEWTEGSYLEPDTENGMAYLEAVRRVFVA